MGIDISPGSLTISISEVGGGLANSMMASVSPFFELGNGAPLSRFLDMARNPMEQMMNSPFGLLAGMTGQVLESLGRQMQPDNAFGDFPPMLNGNRPAFNQEMGEMLDVIGGLVAALGMMLEQLQGRTQQNFPSPRSFMRPPGQAHSDPVPAAPMNGDSALRELTANFDKLANGKSTFNNSDLRRATNSPDKKLAAAAQFMLDNKTFATGVDVANGANRHKHEKADGKVSRDDLRTALQSTQGTPLEKASLQELGKEAEQLFSTGNRTISRAELGRIAIDGVLPDGSSASKQMKEAANVLLHDPSMLGRLDVAHAASKHQELHSDGEFGRADLAAVLERMG